MKIASYVIASAILSLSVGFYLGRTFADKEAVYALDYIDALEEKSNADDALLETLANKYYWPKYVSYTEYEKAVANFRDAQYNYWDIITQGK